MFHKQTEEQQTLYTRVASPGEPIPINIKPVKVNAMILGGTEIRQAAQRLRNISVHAWHKDRKSVVPGV